MKKNIILIVTMLVILLVGGSAFKLLQSTNDKNTKEIVLKKEKSQNYTISYALHHYKSYDELLKDNKPIQGELSDKTYVIKGDGTPKHSGGWTFKEGKGTMFEISHKKGQVDYKLTTDNKDVTTLGAIKKAFQEK